MSLPLRIADYEDYAALSTYEKAKQIIKLEAAKDKIDQALSELRADLLTATKEQGVLTLKTEDYTITRATRETLKVSDHKAAAMELDAMNVPVMTETVLSDSTKKVLKELIKQGNEFDNAQVQSTEYVSIKINKKD